MRLIDAIEAWGLESRSLLPDSELQRLGTFWSAIADSPIANRPVAFLTDRDIDDVIGLFAWTDKAELLDLIDDVRDWYFARPAVPDDETFGFSAAISAPTMAQPPVDASVALGDDELGPAWSDRETVAPTAGASNPFTLDHDLVDPVATTAPPTDPALGYPDAGYGESPFVVAGIEALAPPDSFLAEPAFELDERLAEPAFELDERLAEPAFELDERLAEPAFELDERLDDEAERFVDDGRTTNEELVIGPGDGVFPPVWDDPFDIPPEIDTAPEIGTGPDSFADIAAPDLGVASNGSVPTPDVPRSLDIATAQVADFLPGVQPVNLTPTGPQPVLDPFAPTGPAAATTAAGLQIAPAPDYLAPVAPLETPPPLDTPSPLDSPPPFDSPLPLDNAGPLDNPAQQVAPTAAATPEPLDWRDDSLFVARPTQAPAAENIPGMVPARAEPSGAGAMDIGERPAGDFRRLQMGALLVLALVLVGIAVAIGFDGTGQSGESQVRANGLQVDAESTSGTLAGIGAGDSAAPEPTTRPTTTPVAEPSGSGGAQVSTAPLATLGERQGILRNGKLYLEGPIPTRELMDTIVAKANAVMGADNVVNNYVIHPDAPAPTDGIVRLEVAGNFEEGTASITPGFEPALELGVSLLNLNPQATMLIEGHSADGGDPDENRRLSLARAAAIVEWLVVRGGIEPSRLEARGWGSDQPISDTGTELARERNRRIDVKIFGLLQG